MVELSDNLKREWLLSLSAGTVLKIKHKEFNKPYKRFIVMIYNDIFENKDILHLMLIRSEIPDWAIEKNRQDEYLPIYAKDYDFLKHDSYINCNPKSPIPIDDILPQIEGNIKQGKLLTETIKEIIQKIKQIKIKRKKEKERIISAFEKVINNSVPT